MKESDFKKLKVGEVTSQRGSISSWSHLGGYALEFAERGSGSRGGGKRVPVIFVMPGGTKKGLDLTTMSIKREGEVLVSAKAKQKIQKISFDDRLGAWLVGVDEV